MIAVMKIGAILFAVVILLASACSNSKLVTAWKLSGSTTRPYKK
jgi:hypothetical protein